MPTQFTPPNLTNPAEIEANQRGEITPAQRERLNAMVGRGLGCGLLLIPLYTPFVCIVGSMLLLALKLPGLWIALFAALMIALSVAVGVGVFLNLGWGLYRNSARLQKDLQTKIVRQADGQLAFGRDGYEVQTPERRLMLPRTLDPALDAGGLLPGVTYRFYYLPESGFVLSAEITSWRGEAASREALTGILAAANRFDAGALEANRQGRLLLSQIPAFIPEIVAGVISALVAVALIGFLSVRTIFQGRVFEQHNIVGVLFIGGVGSVFGLLGLYLLGRGALDVIDGQVAVVEGIGHKRSRTSAIASDSPSTTHYYLIGGKQFPVSRRAFRALIAGLPYRAYYAPHSQRLVNIEPLQVPNP